MMGLSRYAKIVKIYEGLTGLSRYERVVKKGRVYQNMKGLSRYKVCQVMIGVSR